MGGEVILISLTSGMRSCVAGCLEELYWMEGQKLLIRVGFG